MTADVLKVDNRCKAPSISTAVNDHRGIMPTFTRNSKAYLSDGTEVDAGVARFEQGKFDKAVLVEEGATNLCTNPSFEINLTGWTFLTGLYERTDIEKFFGSYSLKLTNPDTATLAQAWYEVPSPSSYAGKTVTFSVMVKASVANRVCIQIREYDGITYKWSSRVYHPGDGTWQRLVLTYTLGAIVTSLTLQLIVLSGTPTTTAYFDGIQLEAKPYATSFIDGTRAAETLTIPTAGVLNPQEGRWRSGIKWDVPVRLPPLENTITFGLNSKLWNIYQRDGVENNLRFLVGDSWSGLLYKSLLTGMKVIYYLLSPAGNF